MSGFHVGDRVRLSVNACGQPEPFGAVWTIRVIQGEYALVENPQLGKWQYPIEWLRLHLSEALPTAA